MLWLLIIGESHVRGYVAGLSANLGHSFNITGYVKPNSNLDIIMTTAKSQSKNMIKNDVIILCGSEKNIGKNEAYKMIAVSHNLLEIKDTRSGKYGVPSQV